MSLENLEEQAARYAAARETLLNHLAKMQAEIDEIKQRNIDLLRGLANNAREHREHLYNAIESSPELFERPRTREIHGIKCGYRKMPGQVVFDDPTAVIQRIEKQLPEQVPTLVSTRRTLNKSALQKLPAASLKKLGVSIAEVDDVLVARPVASEFEKTIDALLADNDGEPEVLL